MQHAVAGIGFCRGFLPQIPFLAMFMGWLVGGVLFWILKLGHRWLVAGLS